jgi:hypothetical protein
MKTIMGIDASRSLMHGDAATTRKHYIDVRHLPPDNAKLPICWEQNEPAAVTLPTFQAEPVVAFEDDPALAWL